MMEDKNLIIVAAGATLTAILGCIGYIGRRYISREREREQASLMASAADIASKLKANGLTFEEVDSVKQLIIERKKRKTTEKTTPKLISESHGDLEIADNDDSSLDSNGIAKYWTQTSMNQRAFASLNVARANLEEKLTELYTIMDDPSVDLLERTQEKWEEFVKMQVELAGYEVKGGSMESMQRNFEEENLCRQRIITIQGMIDCQNM